MLRGSFPPPREATRRAQLLQTGAMMARGLLHAAEFYLDTRERERNTLACPCLGDSTVCVHGLHETVRDVSMINGRDGQRERGRFTAYFVY